MADTDNETEFPVEYAQVLDEVIEQESFTTKYQVQGAEFAGSRSVKVPERKFKADDKTKPYDRFKNPDVVPIVNTTYTLDKDEEKAFVADALDVQDQPLLALQGTAAEFERRFFVPQIDAYFFGKAAAAAKTKATEDITAANVKELLRDARTQMVNNGFARADLYMTSDALACLEDSLDRQFAGEGEITDVVGRYNIFDIHEVPDARLGQDFIVIGQSAATSEVIRLVWKRVVSKYFPPEINQSGDDHLLQLRWVYGTIALKNKNVGLFAHKGTNAPDCSVKPMKLVQMVPTTTPTDQNGDENADENADEPTKTVVDDGGAE